MSEDLTITLARKLREKQEEEDGIRTLTPEKEDIDQKKLNNLFNSVKSSIYKSFWDEEEFFEDETEIRPSIKETISTFFDKVDIINCIIFGSGLIIGAIVALIAMSF